MLNIVIGAGILALPGLAVKQAGDHAFLAWMLCALAALPLLGVFIMLGRRFPDAGGIAHYAMIGFGRHGYTAASFLLLGAVLFGLPSIALTGGHYLAEVTGLPPFVSGLLLLALATGMHLAPSAAVSRVNAIMAIVITVTIVALAVAGALLAGQGAQVTRPPTLLPENLDTARAALPFMMLFFAFTGWEMAANTAEEFRNPRRDFPLAMLISFALTVSIYLLIAFAIQRLDLKAGYETAFVDIARVSLGASGSAAVAWLAGAIILANLAGAIWAVSRMLFSLAREGILPAFVRDTRAGTPWVAVGITSLALAIVLCASGAGLFRLDWMLALAGQNFLILYGFAAFSFLRVARNMRESLLAVVAGALSVYLVAGHGLAPVYPLGLVAAALVVASLRRPAFSQTAREEARGPA
jgi:amino acid efflux transporter